MLVIRIIAFHVHYFVVGTQTCKSIDVAVSIIPSQGSMFQPKYMVYTKDFSQHLLNVSTFGTLSIGVMQAGSSCEQRPHTVTFNTSPFQFKVQTVYIATSDYTFIKEAAVDGIIL